MNKEQLLKEVTEKDTSHRKVWEKCLIGIFWNGVENVTEEDIVFPPGHYIFNSHTVYNWKTREYEMDVLYIIPMEASDMSEEHSDIYRLCPNGVVVRKLQTREGAFVFGDTYLPSIPPYVLNVPKYVHINWNEFVWRSHA